MAEIVSLKKAVASLVHDGDYVVLEGFTHLIPFAAGHEIIRQGRRGLTVARMTPDLIYDQLIGMGCVRKLVFSWGGNPGVGSLHRLRDAVENAWPRALEIEEHSHAGMAAAYAAGAANLPFGLLRGYNGGEPDWKMRDANHDGARDSSQDEFIEVINRTAMPVHVGGYSISDADSLRFSFPAGAIIPAGEVAVIFGGGAPTGDFGNAHANGLVFTAPLSLNNTGDTITIKNASAVSIESVAYGATEGGANQSINRNPDEAGIAFANHSSIAGSGGRLFSPGTRVNGSTQECLHTGISLGDHTAVGFETRSQALTTAIILPCELTRFGNSREQTLNRRDRWHAVPPLTLLS